LASASPYLFELFSADDETKGNVRENTVIYKLNCSFQRAALDVLVDYAYTAKYVSIHVAFALCGDVF